MGPLSGPSRYRVGDRNIRVAFPPAGSRVMHAGLLIVPWPTSGIIDGAPDTLTPSRV